MPTESATRKEIIDSRLNEAGWNIADRTQVIEEYFVSLAGDSASVTAPALRSSREFSDYVLLGKNGRPLAVVEAKKSSNTAELGREQAKQYCYNIQVQHGGELGAHRRVYMPR